MLGLQELSNTKDRAQKHIGNGAFKGFIGCIVANTIPGDLFKKLPEGTTTQNVAGAVAYLVDKVITEKEFMDKAAVSKIYSAVYISGYLQGLKGETNNLISEAQDVKTVEDVVMSIQELMANKNVANISIALSNKLKKDLIDDNVRYQRERAREEELINKIDNKVGDRVGTGSATSTEMTNDIDNIFKDDPEDYTEPTVDENEEGTEPTETPTEEGEDTVEKTPEEIEEEERLVAESERIALDRARRPYYTDIFEIVKKASCDMTECTPEYSKLLIVGAIGLGNFLDQLNILPINAYIPRLKSAVGYKEPAAPLSGLGLNCM